LTAAGDLDEALAVADASVEAAPNEAAGHWALGAVHVKRGDGAAALAAFDRMSEISRPGQIQQLPATWIAAATARAVALTLLDRHVEAIRLYEDVLAVDPAYFERWHELAPYYRRCREGAGPQSPTAA
jgi:tetratricopeptide (TPR) repeat protein